LLEIHGILSNLATYETLGYQTQTVSGDFKTFIFFWV